MPRIDIPDDAIDGVYIHGYKARDLLALALMLENEEVKPADLNEYVRNIEHSFTVLEKDFEERCLKLTRTYDERGEF